MTKVDARPERPLGRIEAVVSRLRSYKPGEVGKLLDEKHGVDPRAGIIIVGLPGEVTAPVGRRGESIAYHFHGARVLTSSPETPNFVNPHYHLIGEEPYVILSGDAGEMNIGQVRDRRVTWRDPQHVTAGDLIVVEEGEVHSLRNVGSEPLDFVFACPDAHLQDYGPEHLTGDRVFTKSLPNGIPSHYPKQ